MSCPKLELYYTAVALPPLEGLSTLVLLIGESKWTDTGIITVVGDEWFETEDTKYLKMPLPGEEG